MKDDKKKHTACHYFHAVLFESLYPTCPFVITSGPSPLAFSET